MSRRVLILLALSSLLIFLLFAASIVYYRSRTTPSPRTNVLAPSEEPRLTTVIRDNFSAFVATQGEEMLAVMDFTEPLALDPLPPGWWHRRFLTRAPMDLSFGRIDGQHALRLATDDSASMLIRYTDVDLATYPLLSWDWLIEDPIDSSRDETTAAGDDHPARLFIRFSNDSGRRRALEIIWGNELQAGDYKTINGFPHYVANGGDGNIGRWWTEEVDLLALYREFWPEDAGAPRITDIGLFCDSDETGDDSVAWFASVSLVQRISLPGEAPPTQAR
ncbi:MAG: DUF3047 domain-containing protein [Pseudohongiellaceae bacterium]